MGDFFEQKLNFVSVLAFQVGNLIFAWPVILLFDLFILFLSIALALQQPFFKRLDSFAIGIRLSLIGILDASIILDQSPNFLVFGDK